LQRGALSAWTSEHKSWDATGAIPSRLFVWKRHIIPGQPGIRVDLDSIRKFCLIDHQGSQLAFREFLRK
jgi:hypothetical protein